VVLDLFDGSTPVATVTSRWHYQTWGNKRPPEYRLTKNIESALLARASVDDVLQFERQLGTVDRFRVTLIRSGTTTHKSILASNPGARWGIAGSPPESLAGIRKEMDDIEKSSSGTFQLFGGTRSVSDHRRLLRDAAFARLVKRAYGHACAACGVGWLVPLGMPGPDPISEPEAAHIVPVAMRGPDDLRNALCLCRAHHWAFDRKVMFVDPNLCWRVVTASQSENRNTLLNDVDGTPLRAPANGFPAPSPDALEWHRKWVLSA